MTKIYKLRGEDAGVDWVREDAEILREFRDGTKYPKAYAVIPSWGVRRDLQFGTTFSVLFCAARKTGSFECLSGPDASFDSRDSAARYVDMLIAGSKPADAYQEVTR